MYALNHESNQSYLAEIHALDSLTTQGRADGRTWACLASSDNELHNLISSCYFPCHLDVTCRGSRTASGGDSKLGPESQCVCRQSHLQGKTQHLVTLVMAVSITDGRKTVLYLGMKADDGPSSRSPTVPVK